MRCYHFGNFYLSSIQQGIQSAHAQMELFVKYREANTTDNKTLFDWAINHKTMICLNGGMASNLLDINAALITFHDQGMLDYPYATFNEEDDALNGTMTNVAIVLPEKMYIPKGIESLTQNALHEFVFYRDTPNGPTTWVYNECELYILDILSKSRLAS